MKQFKIYFLLLCLSIGALPLSAQTYVQTNWGSYYKTDIKPTASTKVVTHMGIYGHASYYQKLFGVLGKYYMEVIQGDDEKSAQRYHFAGFSKSSARDHVSDDAISTSWADYNITFEANGYSVEYKPQGTNYYSQFATVNWTMNGNLECSKELCIGAAAELGSDTFNEEEKSDVRIYDFSIYEGSTLMRHYVAGKYNGQPILFETLTQTVLQSSGFNGAASNATVVVDDACEHKFVNIEKKDGESVLKAHCYLCDKWMTIPEWDQIREKANEDDQTITLTDAYLNMQADSTLIGSTEINLTGTSDISYLKVFDANMNSIYDLSTSGTSLAIDFPARDSICTYYILSRVSGSAYSTDETDKVPTWMPKKVTVKPFHSITAFQVDEQSNADAVTGIRSPKIQIKMAIDNPDDEDIMSSDRIMIQRAYQPDFSDATTVTAADLDASSFNQKETLSDGTIRGWFTYTDDDEASTYSTNISKSQTCFCDSLIEASSLSQTDKTLLKSFYTGYDRPIYYRAVRAMVTSIWNDAKCDYNRNDSIHTTSMLPKVTDIAVVKDSEWSDNKKVTVSIALDNPYPWEYNTVLKEGDVRAVMGDKVARRYVWSDDAKIQVVRFTTDGDLKQQYAAGTYTIAGDEVKYDTLHHCWIATVEDVQSYPYIHYYYKAIVDTAECVFPACLTNDYYVSSKQDADDCYSEMAALVSDFEATRGTTQGQCNLTWQVASALKGTVKLERRDYKQTMDGKWSVLSEDVKGNSYADTEAYPGKVYEYRLSATAEYLGETLKTSVNTIGWCSYYGTISGRVLMPDGTGLAGATIRIARADAISIEDVYDENGNLLLKGVHEGLIAHAPRRVEGNDTTVNVLTYDSAYVQYIVTDDRGRFSADSLVYLYDGSVYTVTVNYGKCSFSYNDTPTSTATLTLSKATYKYTDVEFVCTTVYRVTGRVLYENSTVPVRDAHFRVLGKDVFDNGDKKVSTDQSGDFSFNVPQADINIQVYKEGHHFLNDGYYFDGTSTQDTIFTPKHDISNCSFSDLTKVRLVGRLCGGSTQGDKELGFGLSTNNLGDSLTMVLQLEGDNTAQLVYLEDDPDNTNINYVVANAYTDGTQTIVKDSTLVYYQKKRIVIKPSTKTGEFFVDLFPTKYKITQLSAQGYSTLYNAGEGFEVLDLSNDNDDNLKTYETQIKTISQKDTIIANCQVAYNHAYKRVYHNPVSVTYTQLVYGQEVGYLGEKSMTTTNLAGTKVKTQLVTLDSKTKQATSYTLGYPLFDSGQTYTLKVRAHEDYYYNGVKTLRPDMVYMNHGTLKAINGFVETAGDSAYAINERGEVYMNFTPSNTTFSLTGEDALRQVTMSALVDGYYYEAEPLKAYVTGYKIKGTDVTTFDESVSVLDVLRDPPGATSSATLSKGTTYNWTHDFNFSVSASLKLSVSLGTKMSLYTGAWGGVVSLGPSLGTLVATDNSTNFDHTFNFTFPFVNYTLKRSANYTMTTDEAISTSTDPKFAGAMSDVYIGTVNTGEITTVSTIGIIDSLTYELCKSAVTVISKGRDTENQLTYLVVSDKVGIILGGKRSFFYSQRHILGTLIPGLVEQRNDLLRTGTKAEVQAMANNTGKSQYWSKVDLDDDNFGLPDSYEKLDPEDVAGDATDKVSDYNRMITAWLTVIYNNESAKVEAIRKGSPFKQYSLTSDATVTYSESSSGSDTQWKQVPSVLGVNVLKPETWTGSLGLSTDYVKSLNKLLGFVSSQTSGKQVLGPTNKDAEGNPIWEDNTSIQTTVTKNSVSLTFPISLNLTNNTTYSKTLNRTVSYTMGLADNSYMDVNVYRVKAANDNIGETNWVSQGGYSYDKNYNSQKAFDSERPADFIYSVRGGATRHPYSAADSTLVYPDPDINAKDLSTVPVELNRSTAKIDNPRVTIVNPVVNNQPQDEAATFQVILSNESEMTGDVSLLKPSAFSLLVDDASNPNGAKVSIDGQPLTSGRTFYINPGQNVTKTMTVARGKGYDFENLKLQFADESFSLQEDANFSVHFLPTSSPVTLTSPTDKWVMNTLSAHDDNGFYIPVEISGYNLGYDNFDHIELQYKKQTEGESQWTNLCSYYADDSLYEAASGTKELIDAKAGKISNIKFYGEKDSIEMNYDLRAVTFCRLGTGYVTRSSSVVSGTKDTRCPELFGLPEPTSGILTYEDVLKLPFNEPIAYNYLDKTTNFQVVGYTNETSILNSATLGFPGTGDQNVYTSVDRNLSNRDFTIDLLASTTEKGKRETFFSQGGSMSNMAFGVTEDNRLFARMNNETVYSQVLDQSFTTSLYHVGMVYHHSGSKVEFFANNGIIKGDGVKDHFAEIYGGVGPIYLGKDIANPAESLFKGDLLEVRLWGKALEDGQIGAVNGKHLSGYEQQLIANWPLNETQGTIAKDHAHGANLTLEGTQWNNISGYSLRTDHKPIQLRADYINADATNLKDYTYSFWFRTESIDAGKTASLLKAGQDSLAEAGRGKMFIGFVGDSLILKSNGNVFLLAKTATMANQQWHHLAFAVDRSNNLFVAYVDGEAAVQDDATLIDGLSSDYLALGDSSMVANFDKFTEWNLAMPKGYLTEFSNTLYTGEEMGLHVYLPFSYRKSNSSGVMNDYFSEYNEVVNSQGKVVRNESYDLIKSELDESNKDRLMHAPLRECPNLNKLNFRWTSDGNALQINIDEQTTRINKQNLFLTVRGVEDLNGNTMRAPVMWSVFVDKNVLRWDDRSTTKVNVSYGVPATISLPFRNLCGRRIDYTVSKEASWLTIDNEMGIMNAEENSVVTATVDAGLSPGVYNDILYLIDEDGLADALNLEVTVEASDPGWQVDRTRFDRSMNLMAEVKILNGAGNYIVDTSTDDKVAAFIDNECVGVSNISRATDGSRYLYMTIYGNAEIAKAKPRVGFLLWNKETGRTYELEYCKDDNTIDYVTYETNSAVGCPPANPIVLRTTDYEEQTLTLNQGWNWVSFNVAPEPIEGINTIFLDPNHLTSDGDIIKHVDYVQYSEQYGSWLGTLSHTDYHNVYQVYVTNGGDYKVLGRRLTGDSLIVNVNPGWNDLPYLLQYSKPLEQALTDFQIGEKASDGDIIKSMDEFAVASASKHTWVGTLSYMKPGQGYYLCHNGEATWFSYQDDNVVTNNSMAPRKAHAYNSSMPVIAVFADDANAEDGDELLAYAGSRLVGRAQTVTGEDGKPLFFLNVNANEGEAITFAQERDGEVIARTSRKVGYNGTSVVGSLESPYRVSFTDESAETGWYDMTGRKLPDGYRPQQHGIYIKDGKKQAM